MDRDSSSVIVGEWINRGSWHEEWAVMEYVFIDTDGRRHTLWVENAETLRMKGELMDEYALAGTAVWRKNQGTDTLWAALADITAEDKNAQE